ncbi:hypothetical protein CA267_012450 [Alteromonas pelagimontana]|uniref:Rhamnosyl transferase n=1 Tax=Alteromonas pelagimontana TaxID=1858656 RepID=A0A6M4MEK4_9ALTE|nr:glycosyltransferase [Alteromonas pelagimontana]QJR81532.1 hypothetical protein CA267_012450 [Alteromonas pelagimontana]
MLKWWGRNSTNCNPDSYLQKLFIPIRFSVLTSSKNWAISRKDNFDIYKEALFAKERMEAKLLLFRELVVPNLRRINALAEDVDLQVIVLSSTHLPDSYKAQLNEIVNGCSFISISYIDESAAITPSIDSLIRSHLDKASSNVAFATTRLDDDDLLAEQFIPKIKKYIHPGFCDHIISFSRGYESYLDIETLQLSPNIKISSPKIALGLSHINFYNKADNKLMGKIGNVYGAGDHTLVHENFTLIIDHSRAMFLRMSYNEQDTGAKGIFARIKRRDCAIVEADEIFNRFPELHNLVKPHNSQ